MFQNGLPRRDCQNIQGFRISLPRIQLSMLPPPLWRTSTISPWRLNIGVYSSTHWLISFEPLARKCTYPISPLDAFSTFKPRVYSPSFLRRLDSCPPLNG